MRLLYIRNLVKEWLKATFRLFRHTLSHKNGVKKDTEGILNIDINNFSSTFHTDDKKKIILMLHLVSRRQRVYLLEGRSRHFNSIENYIASYIRIYGMVFRYFIVFYD